jgi:hypothetical protein
MWNDKPDWYLIPVRNPTGTCMNFYPCVWVRVWISTRNLFADGWLIALPDPNPTRYHPYSLPYPRGGLWRCHMFILPCPICNYVHRIMLQFYVSFCIFIPHMVSYFLHVSPLIRVVQSCHRRVCLRYLRLIWGPLVIFFSGSGVAEWLLLVNANANGGSRVYCLLSLVPYPKRVHFASLTLSQLTTRGPNSICPWTSP